MKILISIFALLLTLNFYSQSKTGNKYVYIQSYSDKQFKIKDTINQNLILLNSKSSNPFEVVEAGMFKIDRTCKLKNLEILINNKKVKINLSKFKKHKFFNIKIYRPRNNEDEQSTIKIRYGDVILIINNCELKDKCNLILVEFPQIILKNKNIEVTLNQKFKKYLFK